MSSRADKLAQRREILITRAALERLEVAGAVQEVQEHLSFANEIFSLVRTLKQYPIIAGLLTAGAATVGWQGLGGWVQRGWALWQLSNNARRWAQNALATWRR
jgi:hypothetical protein